MSSRHLLAASVALVLSCASAQATGPFELSYIGQQIVPTGTLYAGTTVGGLSSIDYNPATGRYLSISDDRSALNPARFYELSLDLNQFSRSATPGMAGVSFSGVTTIQPIGGGTFATNTVDPESLRLDAARGKIYWSNEGQRSAAGFQNPTVREMNLDGSYSRTFAVPDYYNPSGSVSGLSAGDKGVYNNLAFENMTLSSDRNTLYVATENALAQDSLPSSVSNGSRSRILSFDVASGAAGAEYVYEVEPVAFAPSPAGSFATNGLTDFIAVGDRQFITIERSFSTGAGTNGIPATGNTIRIFYADARGATDVAGVESITSVSGLTTVSKTLLLNLSSLKNDDGSTLSLDNIEGITFGPSHNGKQTLILASDNNFSGTQFTQFIALEIAPVPEAGTWAMLLAGLGLLGVVRRR
ncbi:esterase-like activity of phytase family protein [Viridibacterium curvum]|uniref:Esterase-like activity of phytase family protein n=1 Tax=Viridibacterium curvum TaxID=1101404 RepID=A0ABP9QQM3_9RHOO